MIYNGFLPERTGYWPKVTGKVPKIFLTEYCFHVPAISEVFLPESACTSSLGMMGVNDL
jgi:hypothetical protein